jgi:CheY-like chemotaxis protein
MKNDFLKGKRVLIAEDDFVNQKLISHSMQTTGASFDIVSNGREAIEHLMMGTYDLIMMDINMPEIDGFEATEYIRKNMKLTTPIIAMTGWSSKDDSNKFEQVGMNGTLAKPFGLDILYKTLYEALIDVKPTVASEGNEEVLIDETPNVDLSLLNELSESDSEYKKTIVQMFLDSIAIKDYDALAKAAHYAKSSLSVINVEDLRGLVAKIEMNCKKNEHLDELDALVKRVKTKYNLVVEILLEELKKD